MRRSSQDRFSRSTWRTGSGGRFFSVQRSSVLLLPRFRLFSAGRFAPKVRKIARRATCAAGRFWVGDACRDLAEFLDTFAGPQSASAAALFVFRSRPAAGEYSLRSFFPTSLSSPVVAPSRDWVAGGFPLQLGFRARCNRRRFRSFFVLYRRPPRARESILKI